MKVSDFGDILKTGKIFDVLISNSCINFRLPQGLPLDRINGAHIEV
jgi:hypothetical protein